MTAYQNIRSCIVLVSAPALIFLGGINAYLVDINAQMREGLSPLLGTVQCSALKTSPLTYINGSKKCDGSCAWR